MTIGDLPRLERSPKRQQLVDQRAVRFVPCAVRAQLLWERQQARLPKLLAQLRRALLDGDRLHHPPAGELLQHRRADEMRACGAIILCWLGGWSLLCLLRHARFQLRGTLGGCWHHALPSRVSSSSASWRNKARTSAASPLW
jgi:hypothetical protein